MKETEENYVDELASVPLVVYESTQIRLERTIKRLIIGIVLAVCLMFASNALWLWAWTSYDYGYADETTYKQNGDGNNVIGDGNGVTYEPEHNETEDVFTPEEEKKH